MKSFCAKTGRRSGFTLIEVMVVMVLLGVIASAMVMAIRGSDIEDKVDEETRRLYVLMRMAREEAIIQRQELALAVTPEAYTFQVLDDEGKWKNIDNAKIFRPREMKHGLGLVLEVENLTVKLGSSGKNDEDKDKEEDKDEYSRIYLLSSGEIEPETFELIIHTDDNEIQYRLIVDEEGDLKIVRPGDEFG